MNAQTNCVRLGKIRKSFESEFAPVNRSHLCVVFVQDRVRQEWWDTRCLATVCLETQSTLPHAWSPQAYVRDAFIRTTVRVKETDPTAQICSFLPALRIHTSQSTINILQRTDCKFEYEKRGETYLKVSKGSLQNHSVNSFAFKCVYLHLICRGKARK